MRQYETFELQFAGEVLTADYADISLSATFTCGGETKTVKGFYDGEGVYKVRFLPEKPGEYTWKASDAVNAEGTEICEAADEHHGLVKAEDSHFAYEWASHAGEEAYLWFNDRQCFGEQTLPLPDDKRYFVELIDVWNMTRTVLEDNACGATMLRLPGKEGLAVLATWSE